MNTIIDITKCTGEELRHYAYLADQRAERANERRHEMFRSPPLPALGDPSCVSSEPAHNQFKDLGDGPVWDDALAKQEAHHLAHPEQLAVIVRQIAEWTDDKRLIAAAAVLHAEKCGIPREIFVPVIVEAMSEVLDGH